MTAWVTGLAALLAAAGIVVLLLRKAREVRDREWKLDFDHGFEVWVSYDGGVTWERVWETEDLVEACVVSLDAEYALSIPGPVVVSAGKMMPS